MVQGYYTLQEAAQYLGMPAEELKQMAQRNQIRSFQDRGTLRFRTQDIQELGRQRGISSEPELQLGDAGLSKSGGPKSGGPKSGGPKSGGPKSAPRGPGSPKTPAKGPAPEVFDFELGDDSVELGQEVLQPGSRGGSSPASGSPPRNAPRPAASPPQPRSGATPRSGVRSPVPQQKVDPGSDSDVRLVGAGPASSGSDSDVRLREKDSDIRLTDSGATRPKSGSAIKSPPQTPRSPKPGSAPQPVDSGVRLVPMDSDSDVKIVGATSDEVPLGEQPEASASDSNVRLEKVNVPGRGDDEMLLTEEINLDEEIKKQEERLKQQSKQPTRVKPKSELRMPPPPSPFELSESDVGSSPTVEAARSQEDSSDFDLAAAQSDSGNFNLAPSDDAVPATPQSSDDFSLELADDGSVLDDDGGRGLTGPTSGINLSNPVDAGISLEEGQESGDSIDFDLSLEVEEATPRPAQMKSPVDSDSEFELSLEVEQAGAADSDSEFELTLDDSSGEVGSLEDAPQAKAGGEQDIFESDFEIPALAEEEGSEAATVDTELESSDFDIALDDSELAAEEESGSQVVALDEEVSPDSGEVAIDEEPADVEEEAAAEDEEDEDAPVREVVKVIRPAPWGVMPALVMLPTVVVMLLLGFMGFELVQSSAGYRPPGFMSKVLGEMIGMEFPKR